MVFVTALSPILGQSRPPNFSPDAIPDTSFSCEDKITGGYYADLEADCQLFHVCVQVSEFEVRSQLLFNIYRQSPVKLPDIKNNIVVTLTFLFESSPLR